MNDLYEMPPKCQNCPCWEWAVSPWLCDCGERYKNNDIPEQSQSKGINDVKTIIKTLKIQTFL